MYGRIQPIKPSVETEEFYMRQVIMEAESLQGYLTSKDNAYLKKLDELYNQTIQQFTRLDAAADIKEKDTAETEIIALNDKMGKILQEICKEVPQLIQYRFCKPCGSIPCYGKTAQQRNRS